MSWLLALVLTTVAPCELPCPRERVSELMATGIMCGRTLEGITTGWRIRTKAEIRCSSSCVCQAAGTGAEVICCDDNYACWPPEVQGRREGEALAEARPKRDACLDVDEIEVVVDPGHVHHVATKLRAEIHAQAAGLCPGLELCDEGREITYVIGPSGARASSVVCRTMEGLE